MPRKSSAAAIDPGKMRSHADQAAVLAKALGNKQRLMIRCLLVERERSLGESATLPVARPNPGTAAPKRCCATPSAAWTGGMSPAMTTTWPQGAGMSARIDLAARTPGG